MVVACHSSLPIITHNMTINTYSIIICSIILYTSSDEILYEMVDKPIRQVSYFFESEIFFLDFFNKKS